MFSHLTDRELSILFLVIAIFTVKPIPLFPDRHPHPKATMFQTSQDLQPDRASLTWGNIR
jgi:hypothetical protein